jgi:uncharacterized protein (TIGR03067 family)
MRSLCLCLVCVAFSAAFAAEADPSKKELTAFKGKWTMERLEFNGKDVTDRYKLAFEFKGDAVTIEGDSKVLKDYGKLRLKLHPDINPKGVDVTVTAGVQLDATLEGIYELKGDRLRLCVKVFGKDRPSEFEAPAGSSTALLTLKRQP